MQMTKYGHQNLKTLFEKTFTIPVEQRMQTSKGLFKNHVQYYIFGYIFYFCDPFITISVSDSTKFVKPLYLQYETAKKTEMWILKANTHHSLLDYFCKIASNHSKKL
jgi:hypothetical protein